MALSRCFTLLVALALALAACGGSTATTSTAPIEPEIVAEPTWIRFVHAIPDGPAIDSFVGDVVLANGVGYQQWGEWTEVPSGERDVTIRQGEAVEYSDMYDFQPNRRYWVFAYGSMNPQGSEVSASFVIAPEESFAATTDDTWIRMVNLATEGEAYGLTITTGGSWNLVFPNLPIGTVSEFKRGPISANSFEVIPAADTSRGAELSFDRDIQVGLLYTFIVSGRTNNGSLDVFHIAETAER